MSKACTCFMSDFTVYWSVRSRRLAIIKIWFKMCLLSVLLCSKMLLCYRHTVKKISHFYDLIMTIYNMQTFYLMFIFYRIYWCSMWARKCNCGPINFEKWPLRFQLLTTTLYYIETYNCKNCLYALYIFWTGYWS